MYFNICASKNKITAHVQLFFFFAQSLRVPQKARNFSPAGHLLKKRNIKYMYFNARHTKNYGTPTPHGKKFKKKIVGPSPEAHLVFHLSAKTNSAPLD
jgi:hypothetical protein